MKHGILYTLLLLSYYTSLQSQTGVRSKSPAEIAFDAGYLHKAISLLREELAKDTLNYSTNYNLACNYALVHRKDSAFYFIDQTFALEKGFNMLTDPDFFNLINDPNWKIVENEISEPYLKANPNFDKELVIQLARMQITDQAFYYHLKLTGTNPHGQDSVLAKHYWHLKDSLNQLNQAELEEIIRTKGWPLISTTGNQGSSTAFLIIQHADLEKQKKYIGTITDLAQKGEARWPDVALMTDRILIREGKKQLYGSQVNPSTHSVLPIEDEINVDKRRAEKGLGPLAEYLTYFGINYEAPKQD
jgi:hypothetical protein